MPKRSSLAPDQVGKYIKMTFFAEFVKIVGVLMIVSSNIQPTFSHIILI